MSKVIDVDNLEFVLQEDDELKDALPDDDIPFTQRFPGSHASLAFDDVPLSVRFASVVDEEERKMREFLSSAARDPEPVVMDGRKSVPKPKVAKPRKPVTVRSSCGRAHVVRPRNGELKFLDAQNDDDVLRHLQLVPVKDELCFGDTSDDDEFAPDPDIVPDATQ